MQHNPLADDVWHDVSRFVLDNKDRWRKAVVEQTGLPFSRIRILRRLGHQSLTVKEVANAATVDAPAATVAVNDLEARGLVVRAVDPENRRSKVVSLTDAGRRMVEIIDATKDPAPERLCELDDDTLAALKAILARLRS